MAVIGVILVTAVFGFALVAYLLKLYFGYDNKKFKLSLIALGVFMVVFLSIFVWPLYQHLEGPADRQEQEKNKLEYATEYAAGN
ncbi:hypothetical protein [Natranaerofaba carboxydovora]|uniref:hypothetical protein n=1 Tax=Natranaerofaba carboxydovora TaxID=2742683 RepID=UPI001F12D41E|nr:hypothetical protein [Natranaerofaba carboxydovora]UMZ75007.1 hypothetical protein ACONDI_02613 [Natranaerofaba carboxydovora]